MHACHSVSVACRPAETRRQSGEMGSVHRSILVGHRWPKGCQRVNIKIMNRSHLIQWSRYISHLQITTGWKWMFILELEINFSIEIESPVMRFECLSQLMDGYYKSRKMVWLCEPKFGWRDALNLWRITNMGLCEEWDLSVRIEFVQDHTDWKRAIIITIYFEKQQLPSSLS